MGSLVRDRGRHEQAGVSPFDRLRSLKVTRASAYLFSRKTGRE
jgi:hypothetical protein